MHRLQSGIRLPWRRADNGSVGDSREPWRVLQLGDRTGQARWVVASDDEARRPQSVRVAGGNRDLAVVTLHLAGEAAGSTRCGRASAPLPARDAQSPRAVARCEQCAGSPELVPERPAPDPEAIAAAAIAHAGRRKARLARKLEREAAGKPVPVLLADIGIRSPEPAERMVEWVPQDALSVLEPAWSGKARRARRAS